MGGPHHEKYAARLLKLSCSSSSGIELMCVLICVRECSCVCVCVCVCVVEREIDRETKKERKRARLGRSILNCMVLFCDNRVSTLFEVESTAGGLAVMQCSNCSPSTALKQ